MAETCSTTSTAAWSLVACMALLLVVVGIALGRRLKKQLAIASKERKKREEHVMHLCNDASVLQHPMCCIAYSTFRDAGRLITHEDARAQHALLTYDTIEDVQKVTATKSLVFISHQWKSRQEPDPEGHDWRAAVLAIECLAATYNLALTDFIVWIDYTSIPQRNRACQALSISSLPFYASFARFFLVLVPDVVHSDRHFNFESYAKRGWCRLEQFARIAMCGVAHMYACHGTREMPAVSMGSNIATVVKAAEVMEGDFTVASDKRHLVDTLASLYYRLVRLHESFALGARVRHNKHGLGRVTTTAAQGRDNRVGVRFDNGTKEHFEAESVATDLELVSEEASEELSLEPTVGSRTVKRSRTTELRNAEVEKLAMSALIYYVRLNKGRLFPEELFSDSIQLIDERLGAGKPPVAPEGHFAEVNSEVISVVLSTDKAAQNAAMLLQARLRLLVARRKEVMANADERAAKSVEGNGGVKKGRVTPMVIQLPDEERPEDLWHLARQASKKGAVVAAIIKSKPVHADTSATKVQAAWRGNKARKERRKKTSSGALKPSPSKSDSYNSLSEESCTRTIGELQARIDVAMSTSGVSRSTSSDEQFKQHAAALLSPTRGLRVLHTWGKSQADKQSVELVDETPRASALLADEEV